MTHSQVLENTKLLRFSFADEILRNVDANGFDEAAWRMLQSVLLGDHKEWAASRGHTINPDGSLTRAASQVAAPDGSIAEHFMVLLAGDWSGDGHGKTMGHLVRANKPRKAVAEAFIAGSLKVGLRLGVGIAYDHRLDHLPAICEDYEDRAIKPDALSALLTHGIDVVNMDTVDPYDAEAYTMAPEHGLRIYADTFVNTAIAVAKVGDPDLVIDVVRDEPILIGGYGLFS